MNKLFFDTETTGLTSDSLAASDPRQCHLVQFAAILLDENDEEVERYAATINPGAEVIFNAQAVKTHGITKEHAEKVGINPAEVSSKFLEMIDKAGMIGGHNLNFDLRAMALAIARTHGETWQNALPVFDTMDRSTEVVAIPPTAKMVAAGRNHYKNPNLSECMRYFFDEDLEGAHDALADVVGSIRVYKKLVDLGLGAVAMSDQERAKNAEKPEHPVIKAVKSRPSSVLTDKEKLREYLIAMRDETQKEAGSDVTTKKGRDAIKSASYSVSRAKSAIDEAGKRLTETWRRKTTVVNEARKNMATEMDLIRDDVRKPLTEWEQIDKDRQKLVADAIAKLETAHIVTIDESADDVQARITEISGWNYIVEENFQDQTDSVSQMRDDVIASLKQSAEDLRATAERDAELNELRREKAEREARDAQEREEKRLAAEREANEKAEAEAKALAAEREQQRISIAAEQAAQAAAEEANRIAQEKIDAANERAAQIEREAIAAKEAREAEIKADEERRAQEAREQEEARLQKIADDKAAAEKLALETKSRENDALHRNAILAEAAKAISERCSIEQSIAHKVVAEIENEAIPHITIKF